MHCHAYSRGHKVACFAYCRDVEKAELEEGEGERGKERESFVRKSNSRMVEDDREGRLVVY